MKRIMENIGEPYDLNEDLDFSIRYIRDDNDKKEHIISFNINDGDNVYRIELKTEEVTDKYKGFAFPFEEYEDNKLKTLKELKKILEEL